MEEVENFSGPGYYVVEIANRANNPIHPAIVYYHGEGSVHNMRFQASYEHHELEMFKNLSDFHYIKLIRKIDMSIQNDFKLVKNIKQED